MAYNSITEENLVTAWTPDLFGPIFKTDSMTLKQVRLFTTCIFYLHKPTFPKISIYNFIYSMY